MYTTNHFSLPSQAEMADFVREHPLGVLAICDTGAVYTSPLPLDLRGSGDTDLFVAGHVARGNDMAKVFASGPPASITFLGPDTYVPAEWFGTRSRIPTWLYCAVEISGRLELSDAARTRDDVTVFIDRLQAATVDGSTWSLAEIPEHLTSKYLQGIVGFRVYDLQIKSCFRLNQRKSMASSDCLAAVLNDEEIAARRELAPMVLQPPTNPAERPL